MVVSVRGAFPYCLIVVFVVHVQARGDPGGDHPGPEPSSRCRARAAADRTGVEDETDLIGGADVEVVADDLLEEDPTRDRCLEHLGQGELGLQDRQVVAVAGGPIGRGERMRGVGPATCAAAHRCPMAPTRSQIACTAAATGSSGSARARTVTGYAFGGARKIRTDRMGGKRPSGQSKPVCRPSAATIPTSGSTPSRRSPKPPESPPCFARSTGFRSVGRPRTDRTPLTPSTGLGTVGRLRATEGGIRCDSQRYVARYCRRYLARREREMSVEGPMDPSSRCVRWGSRNGARAARWRGAR